ncbi:MAG: type II toxin-antitoxin system VapC family toxin [Blastochloris sp.]|nr:type II toxin-antitoxin system VapC family toxin [Blastochloris sp.]
MAWVVDTCILLDIGLDDPSFADASENLLRRKLGEGLLVCPVTFIELAPAFHGQIKGLQEFLFQLGVDHLKDWTAADTLCASRAWTLQVQRRQSQKTLKRPIADILIGAFASRHQGLLTRNPNDFRKLFPSLHLVEP